MQHLVKSLAFAICLLGSSCVTEFNSLADVKSDTALVDANNEFEVGEANKHFELVDESWIAKDKDNQNISGWTYDASGNLYLADADGKIYTDITYENKRFNSDGVYMPEGLWSTSRYEQMCIDLEDGKKVKIGATNADVARFFRYYLKQYRLWDNVISIRVDWENGAYVVELPEDLRYSRDIVVAEIIDKFGIPEGGTSKEIVYDACKRVASNLNYDSDYNNINLSNCLNDSKATCWTYAKCVKTLVEERGIGIETMVGLYNNADHMWLRYRDGETWVYADPTAVDTTGQMNWHNISYEAFVNQYIPEDDIKLEEVK